MLNRFFTTVILFCSVIVMTAAGSRVEIIVPATATSLEQVAAEELTAYLGTCERAARHWFGSANAEKMADYLHAWWKQAPMFERETMINFFWGRGHIPEPERNIRDARKRLEMLAAVDLEPMSAEGRSRLAYFRQFEKTMISFCEVQELAFRPAQDALADGDFDSALRFLENATIEDTMRLYARMAYLDGGDRGEQGILFTLGTRWLPFLHATRQKAGIEPLRINFAPTNHEPLAQNPGGHTFFVDEDDAYWGVRGQRETRRGIVRLDGDPYTSVWAAGLPLSGSMSIPLSTTVPVGGQFRPGSYEASIMLAGEGSGEVVFVEPAFPEINLEPVRATYLRLVCKGSSANAWNSIESVHIPSLASGAPEELVSASGALEGHPATAVIQHLQLNPQRFTASIHHLHTQHLSLV